MEKKIKVAEVVSRLEFGGVESMLLNYLPHFENKEQFDFHIITQDINVQKCIEEFEKIGCTVHIVTHKRTNFFENAKEVFNIMKTEKFDVVHSHMTMTNFYVMFLAWFLKVPKRISHSHETSNATGFKSILTDSIIKYINKLFSTVWMACGYDAGVFLYGKNAVEKGNVLITNNAIDLNKFQVSKEIRDKIRNLYDINSSLCVGHVGRFITVKNHSFVIRIFREFLKLNPDSKLLLVGDGELHEEVVNEVKEMNLIDRVVFTGNITNTNEIFQAMDVFILPSFHEGLPVVSVEAQAAGLPCFISDRVDKRCAFTQGVKFLSIDETAEKWAKSIFQCLENAERYLSEEALTKAGYNIEIEALKLEKIYRGD